MAWFEDGPPSADVDAVLDALRQLAVDPSLGSPVPHTRAQVFEVQAEPWTIRYLVAHEYHAVNILKIY